MQVVKLGSPVTGVQLSPSQDLLATTHVKRRGIYLWYNHLMFGSGADIQPSTRPVNAALPSIATGEPLREWLLCWNHPVTTCDVPPFTCSGTVQVEVRCLCVWQHAVLFGVSTDSNIRHCCKDSTESRAVLPCMQLHACGLDKANLALQATFHQCCSLHCTAQVIKNKVLNLRTAMALPSRLVMTQTL